MTRYLFCFLLCCNNVNFIFTTNQLLPFVQTSFSKIPCVIEDRDVNFSMNLFLSVFCMDRCRFVYYQVIVLKWHELMSYLVHPNRAIDILVKRKHSTTHFKIYNQVLNFKKNGTNLPWNIPSRTRICEREEWVCAKSLSTNRTRTGTPLFLLWSILIAVKSSDWLSWTVCSLNESKNRC